MAHQILLLIKERLKKAHNPLSKANLNLRLKENKADPVLNNDLSAERTKILGWNNRR